MYGFHLYFSAKWQLHYQVKAIKNNENSRSLEFGGESDPDHLLYLQSRP